MKCVIAIVMKFVASVVIGLGAGLLAGGLALLVEMCVCIVCKTTLQEAPLSCPDRPGGLPPDRCNHVSPSALL